MWINNRPIVKTENVEIGFVCQYDGKMYHYLRKIIYARSTRNLLTSNKQWEATTRQNLKTGEYYDIQGEMNYGIDLCEKVGGKNIKYLIDSENANKNDGDIIIIYPIKVGSLLRVLGFPEYLTPKELKYAKKILLDSRYPIKTIKSSISFSELEKLDLLEAKEAIEKMRELKLDGNLSKVTKIERKKSKNNSAIKKFRRRNSSNGREI